MAKIAARIIETKLSVKLINGMYIFLFQIKGDVEVLGDPRRGLRLGDHGSTVRYTPGLTSCQWLYMIFS